MSIEDLNNLHLPFIDKYEVRENVRILRFKGSVDSATSSSIPKLKETVDKEGDISGMNLLLDLEKVSYADTSAVAALVARFVELKRRDKKIGLINVPANINSLLSILKCEDLFSIFNSEEEAIAALK